MKQLLLIPILLLLTPLYPILGKTRQDKLNVTIVLLQQRVWKSAEGATKYRTIKFSFVNNTGQKVIIYGHADDDGFHPIGYTLRYNTKKKEWIYPTLDTSPVKWEDMKKEAFHTYILLPKKKRIFEVRMKHEKLNEQVKRIFYFSYENDEKIVELASLAFVLK